MGLDVTAKIMLAVRLEECLEIKPRLKYNEDTGESYTVNDERTYLVVPGTQSEIDPDSPPAGLHVERCDSDYFLGKVLVGIHFTYSERLWEEIKIPEELKQLAPELRHLARLYLLQIVSS